MHRLKGVILSVEGLEAIRLADAEGRNHEQAAEIMRISRPTFSRVLAEARRTLATAMANGWAIRIEGGSYEISPHPETRFSGRRGRRGARRR